MGVDYLPAIFPSGYFMPYVPSPGRCIYCPSDKGLTDEHVIPTALGGRLILEKASCETCRKITSEFERKVTREMYWPLRMRVGLLGSRKHKKQRPTHWPGVLTDGDDIQHMPIEVGKFPRVYSVMEMAPPGLLTGQPLSSGNPEMKIHLKGDQDELKRFLTEIGAGKSEFTQTLEWAPFSRMIAKICHAYAISVIGLEGVEFFLPKLIRGESDHLAQFVGGVSNKTDELEPPNDLAVGVQEIRSKPHLFARTTVFGNKRFPTYETIVGRITNLNLIQAKLATAIKAR